MKKKKAMRAGVPGRGSKRSPTAAKAKVRAPYKMSDLSDFAAALGCCLQVSIEPREMVEERERLYAAAPSLLHACRLALDCHERFKGHLSPGAIDTLQRVIAKAEGR